MYPVSEEWKAACNQQIRQAQALAKLEIGVFDDKAEKQAVFEFDQSLWECEDTLLSPVAKGGYAAFEPRFFRVDGKQLLMPLDPNEKIAKKFVSKALSGAEGVFAQPPTIRIRFEEERNLVGITLSFGRLEEETPQKICVIIKDSMGRTKRLETEKLKPTQPIEFFMEAVTEISVVFLQTKAPFGRARLERVQFGIGYEYTGTEILELNETKSISPASLELSKAELDFVLDNNKGRFDADANSAVTKFLKQGQTVKLWYGLEPAGTAEWIPAGIWYLESWSANQTARFTATDRLTLLNKTTYEKGRYLWEWQYLYDLAEQVLQDAGVGKGSYQLDEGLKKVVTMAPIPIVSHAMALQLIANRSKMNLFADREGRICIVPFQQEVVRTIEREEVFERATVKRNAELKQVDGHWIWRSRYSGQTKVLAQTRMHGGVEWVRLEHDICLNPVVKTKPETQVEAVHYARVSYLRAPQSTREFEVEIIGTRLTEVKYPIVVPKEKEGEQLTIENPLFDRENSQQVFEWVKEMCGKEIEYQMEIRGLPELDIGDSLKLWNQREGQIVESKLSFSGAFRQQLKVWCGERTI